MESAGQGDGIERISVNTGILCILRSGAKLEEF
jgi:hypothetical protein